MREYRLHLEQNKKSLISNMMKGFRIFVGFLVLYWVDSGYNKLILHRSDSRGDICRSS
jgi:hypothetical protein